MFDWKMMENSYAEIRREDTEAHKEKRKRKNCANRWNYEMILALLLRSVKSTSRSGGKCFLMRK